MSIKRLDRKADRKKASEAASKAWAALTAAQQLKALDERLGKGKGAKKQRARLTAKLD